MTRDEFHKQYYDYSTQKWETASKEADKVNKLAKDFEVEPVEFPGLGICLMVKTASKFIKDLYPELKE